MFRLGMAQTSSSDPKETLALMEACVKDASHLGVNLLAFPECFACQDASVPADYALACEPIDGPFVGGVIDLARSYGMWIAFGMVEKHPQGGLPFNTAVLVDDLGEIRSVYRKAHLYDAHGTLESHRFSAGSTLPQTVATPFGNVCVAICYDLRFCELSRVAALSGCHLLLYVSAWYDGPHKSDHWETLLRARAIENEMFVAGVCKAGEGFVGNSLVADPLGQVIARGSCCESGQAPRCLVVCDIDESLASTARAAMPVLDHRRPELYSALVH